MKKKKNESQNPGQGHRGEQYLFAATLFAGAFGGLVIMAIIIFIINALK